MGGPLEGGGLGLKATSLAGGSPQHPRSPAGAGGHPTLPSRAGGLQGSGQAGPLSCETLFPGSLQAAAEPGGGGRGRALGCGCGRQAPCPWDPPCRSPRWPAQSLFSVGCLVEGARPFPPQTHRVPAPSRAPRAWRNPEHSFRRSRPRPGRLGERGAGAAPSPGRCPPHRTRRPRPSTFPAGGTWPCCCARTTYRPRSLNPRHWCQDLRPVAAGFPEPTSVLSRVSLSQRQGCLRDLGLGGVGTPLGQDGQRSIPRGPGRWGW